MHTSLFPGQQTPSLPEADPRSDRFWRGGRESNFLAEAVIITRAVNSQWTIQSKRSP